MIQVNVIKKEAQRTSPETLTRMLASLMPRPGSGALTIYWPAGDARWLSGVTAKYRTQPAEQAQPHKHGKNRDKAKKQDRREKGEREDRMKARIIQRQ